MRVKFELSLKNIRIWWSCISPIAIFYGAYGIIYIAFINAHPSHQAPIDSPAGYEIELWVFRIAAVVCIFIFWHTLSKMRLPAKQSSTLQIKAGLLVIAFAASLQVLLITFATASGLVDISPRDANEWSFVLTAQILFWVVISPILEGLMFRGIILNRLTSVTDKLQAVIISGVLVGLVLRNVSVPIFVGATTLGIMFSFIYISFRRLWLSVAAHMVVNFLIANVAVLIPIQSTALRFPVLSVLLSIVAIVGIGALLYKVHPAIISDVLDK